MLYVRYERHNGKPEFFGGNVGAALHFDLVIISILLGSSEVLISNFCEEFEMESGL